MVTAAFLIPLQALALLFLPGAAALGAAGARKKLEFRDYLEFVFFAGLLSFAVSSLLGLLLAYLGRFSVTLLSVLALLFALGTYTLFPRRFPRPEAGWGHARELLPLAGILLIGAALFSRPVPYIFGGWDPGVYANTAVHLAREGKLFPVERLAGELNPEEIRLMACRHSSGYLEKYPGFRYSLTDSGRIIPEFYHIFPVWLAVFYSWLGLEGMFFLTPLLGLAALAAVYLAVREMWGGWAAAAAAALLVFNVVQVWQARFPTAEMLSQLLLFSGMAATFKYLKSDRAWWAIAGGTAWGLFILTRVSSLLIWIPVGIFFYCRGWNRFKKNDLAFLLPLALFTAFSFLPILATDGRYFANSIANLRLDGFNWRVAVAGAGFAAAAAILLRLLPSRLRDAAGRAARLPAARWLLMGVVAAAGWYAYSLRPYLGPPSADKTNLVELGWLLGPAVLAAAFLGIFLFIIEERSPFAWLFFLVIASAAAIFVWRQMIHYTYMWAARRFADVIVPGFIIFAVYGIRRIAATGKGGRAIAPVVFLLLLAATVSSSAPLFFHREYRGAGEFMDELAGRLKGGELIVVEGEFIDKIPTALDLTYGFRVLPIYHGRKKMEPILRRLITADDQDAGRIFWLSDKPSPPRTGAGWTAVEKMEFHSPLWERRHDRLPRKADLEARDGNFAVYIFRAGPPK